MKLSRRSEPTTVAAAVEPEPDPASVSTKGRPTPKRRDVVGQRGPVTAPKTRKEAYARQKELTKLAKTARRTPQAQQTTAQRRAALRAGDPSVLPLRDQGPTRKIARDYVDSHRMFSNYLLLLFPVLILTFVHFSRNVVLVLDVIALITVIVVATEGYLASRHIRRIAIERLGSLDKRARGLGIYVVGRAYLPRKWRLPNPQVAIGDEI